MKIPLLIAIGLTVVTSLPAFADTPVAAKDSEGNIHLSGLSGYQGLVAEYGGLPLQRSIRANECGFFRIRSTESRPVTATSNLQIGSEASFNVANLPLEAAPSCRQGQLEGANPSPSAKLKTSEGDVYITGLTAFSNHDVTYNDLPSTRSFRSNTCGTARLTKSGNYDISSGSLTIKDRDTGTTLITVTDLAQAKTVALGPVCRQGVALFGEDWPSTP